MRRGLAQLLPEGHQSIDKRSCKQPDSNARPKHQNVSFSFLSSTSFCDFVLAVGRAAHYRSVWGVLSLVLSTTEMSEPSSPTKPRLNQQLFLSFSCFSVSRDQRRTRRATIVWIWEHRFGLRKLKRSELIRLLHPKGVIDERLGVRIPPGTDLSSCVRWDIE